jgi:PAS domain S-box-containing protein
MPSFPVVLLVLLLTSAAFVLGVGYAGWRYRPRLAALPQQEEQLRKLSQAVEQSPSTVVITDLEGNIEYANPRFAALTGYTLDEALGKNPRFLKSGHTPPAEYERLWQTITAGGEWRGEFLNRKKNGDLYWESASILPIKDSAGRITHYLAVKEDITVRKQLEAALSAGEEKYRRVAENANDGIAILQDGMLRYANQRLQMMLGYSPDELLNQPFEMFIAPEERAQSRDRYTRRLAGEDVPARYDLTLIDQQGRRFEVEINASVMQYEDRPAVLAFVRDITERRRVEEEIQRRNRDLTLLNRVIGPAAATLDITELLTTICRELALAFDVPQAATALLDVDRTTYEVVAEYLSPGRTSALGVRFPVENNAIAEYLLEHRTPLVIPDVRTDPRLVYTPEGRRNIEARETISMLVVPLLVGDDLIGTIGLDATEPREFTEDEIALATSVAAALSRVLHNAYLYRQLRANQSRLRAILDNATVGISLLDVRGRYLQVNDRWAEMLGYRVEELVHRDHFDSIHPDDRPGCQEKLSSLQRGEVESYRWEVRFVCRSGDIFWGDVSVSPLQGPEGTLEALEVVVIDITERKRADEGLLIKESAIASSIDGIALADLNGSVTYVNTAFLDMWGYDERWEVLGRPAVSFWQEPEKAAEMVRTLFSESNLIGEMVAQRKDGTLFDAQLSASMVTDPDGKPICMMASFLDITERKRVEAERERLISELDAFAHTVAHDLKNPLQGIIGYVSLLASDTEQFNRADQQKYLGIIEQYGHRMTSIINELLLLASVRKQSDVRIEPVDMKPVVKSVLRGLDYMIRESEAEIAVSVERWPVACGYAPWIEEVWANYISNAIKYGGSPPRVELGADTLPDGRVRFWVRDNGAGIPPENLDRLFAEFTRLEDTRLEGYGLGLSIVRRIMDRLGGEVGVESTVGQGSVFIFMLPGADGHG